MPLTAKGEKILRNMKEQYGPEKGESVFYASANKGTISGVHDMETGGFQKLYRLLKQFFVEESREPEHEEGGEHQVNTDTPTGAGVAFVSPTGHALFVKRSDKGDHAGEWGFPGGGIEDSETPEECARREAQEELGDCSLDGLAPMDTRGPYHTFRQNVDRRFVPQLNDEATEHTWAPLAHPPRPLHPGVSSTLDWLMDCEDESEAAKSPAKLSETTREKIGTPGSAKREEMPESVFLGPDRTYPVKEKRGEGWQYTEKLLLAAARRARMQGKEEIAKKADAIRAREFGGGEGGEDATPEAWDAWSPEAREAAAKARGAHLHMTATPSNTGRPAFRQTASSHAEVEKHLNNMHAYVKANNLPSHNITIENKHTGEVHNASVHPHGITGRSYTSGSFDEAASEDLVRFASDILLAFDKDPSNREYDRDGRLHVGVSNFSKATVNPYWGKEIPGYDEATGKHALGLDPEKKYMMLRHPDELAKSAASFNGVPLLWQHEPTSAEDHPAELVVGAMGNETSFEHPHLRNSLVVWPKYASEAVEDGKKCELSASYHYDPDMTPGTYEGKHYDGIMRNIVGNHVSLVPKGRAGEDVRVADADIDDSGEWAALEQVLLKMAA